MVALWMQGIRKAGGEKGPGIGLMQTAGKLDVNADGSLVGTGYQGGRRGKVSQAMEGISG